MRSAPEVLEAVATFNAGARHSPELASSVARQTKCWVFDPRAQAFGPANFVGFGGVDYPANASARQGNRTGVAFNGRLTRTAIERAAGASFKANPQLAVRLERWGEALLGRGVFDGVNKTKWRFVTMASAVQGRRKTRTFGQVPAVPVGMVFPNRKQLAAAGVHAPLQAGISGSGYEGADSIVLSGGYEDDVDAGQLVIYTGEGGQDQKSRKHVRDQTLTNRNLALAKNAAEGLPVRVVRGAELDSAFAPPHGFRYDGLYRVESYWHERGRAGFLVWRFRLHRDDPAPAPWEAASARLLGGPPIADDAPGGQQLLDVPARRLTTTQRIVRSTEVAHRVKVKHEHRCQVCGLRLETPGGAYAEGAHIRPLGTPHDGPDVEENILCLCPNHHILFDLGAFTIADDFSLIGVEGRLRTVASHRIESAFLGYHRAHYGMQREGRP